MSARVLAWTSGVLLWASVASGQVLIPASGAPLASPTFTGQVQSGSGTAGAPSYSFPGGNDGFWANTTSSIGVSINGTFPVLFGGSGINQAADAVLQWTTTNNNPAATADLILTRAAAGSLQIKGIEAGIAALTLCADEADDANDCYTLTAADNAGGLTLANNSEDWTTTFTANAVAFTSTTGVINVTFPGTLNVGSTNFSTSGANINGSVTIPAGGTTEYRWSGSTVMAATANGLWNVLNTTRAFGVQLNPGTAAPTVTTCGTGTITDEANVVGAARNTMGKVTATGATACTVTFGTPAWTNAPSCTVTLRNAVTTTPYISAASATVFTVSGLTSNDVFSYICIGRI